MASPQLYTQRQQPKVLAIHSRRSLLGYNRTLQLLSCLTPFAILTTKIGIYHIQKRCSETLLRLFFIASIFRPFRENSRQHGGNKSKFRIIRDEGLLFAETVYNLHTFQHETFLLLAEDINIVFGDWQA